MRTFSKDMSTTNARIRELVRSNYTIDGIAYRLNTEGLLTISDRRWKTQNLKNWMGRHRLGVTMLNKQTSAPPTPPQVSNLPDVAQAALSTVAAAGKTSFSKESYDILKGIVFSQNLSAEFKLQLIERCFFH